MKQTDFKDDLDFKDDFNILAVIVRITAVGVTVCMGLALILLAVLP